MGWRLSLFACASTQSRSLVRNTEVVVVVPEAVVDMSGTRLSKAETRILEQYWKLGTCSVREILDSLPEEERVAYTSSAARGVPGSEYVADCNVRRRTAGLRGGI